MENFLTRKIEHYMSPFSEKKREVAYDVFVKASVDYSASVVAQGAFIALACHESGMVPVDLKLALLSHRDQVARVIKAGEGVHYAHGIKADVKRQAPGIINMSFTTAQELVGLSDAQLMQIKEEYARLKKIGYDMGYITLELASMASEMRGSKIKALRDFEKLNK